MADATEPAPETPQVITHEDMVAKYCTFKPGENPGMERIIQCEEFTGIKKRNEIVEVNYHAEKRKGWFGTGRSAIWIGIMIAGAAIAIWIGIIVAGKFEGFELPSF